jgi:hypothetical protein
MIIALSNAVHLYARPNTREPILTFFTEVPGLEVHGVTKAYLHSPEPMYAVTLLAWRECLRSTASSARSCVGL